MFVKTTARKTKSGTVRYLQLAHNEWDPVAGRSVPKVLLRLRPGGPARPGRDQAAGRIAVPAARPGRRAGRSASAAPELTFCESRPFGGTFVLDALWRRLGIDTVLRGLDTGPAARRAVAGPALPR